MLATYATSATTSKCVFEFCKVKLVYVALFFNCVDYVDYRGKSKIDQRVIILFAKSDCIFCAYYCPVHRNSWLCIHYLRFPLQIDQIIERTYSILINFIILCRSRSNTIRFIIIKFQLILLHPNWRICPWENFFGLHQGEN